MNQPAHKEQTYIRPEFVDARTVVEVRNLVTHYGAREILHGVDLVVREGEK